MKKNEQPLVSVIVPVFNQLDYTKQFIAKAYENTEIPFELIVVNNASTDGTAEFLGNLKNCKVITNKENLGFVKAVNQGFEEANGKYLVGFNNDVIVTDRWLEKMVEVAEKDDKVGVVGLVGNDGAFNQNLHLGNYDEINVPRPIKAEDAEKINDLLEKTYEGETVEEKKTIIFCLALIRKSLVDEIGDLSEEYGIGFGDDGDFCIRAMQAGYKLVVRKDGFFYHFGRTTFKSLFTPQKITEMQNKNIAILEKKYSEHFGLEDSGLEEKLNILVTNNHLKRLGGSETFTYTLVKELERLGHNVDVHTLLQGQVSEKLKDNLVNSPKQSYDLILASHNSFEGVLKNVQGFKIQTCHGIYPALEQPMKDVDYRVSISKEVEEHVTNLGYATQVIHNGIDCDRFKPIKPINTKLKRVLSMCQGETAELMVKEACSRMGLEFKSLREQKEWNVEEAMNWADLVVSLGRGAYEAMACGRNVVVFDHRPYTQIQTSDGMVTPANAWGIIENNFSGRHFQKQISVDGLIEEFSGYNAKNGKFNRRFALEQFNIKKQVTKYFKIFKGEKELSKSLQYLESADQLTLHENIEKIRMIGQNMKPRDVKEIPFFDIVGLMEQYMQTFNSSLLVHFKGGVKVNKRDIMSGIAGLNMFRCVSYREGSDFNGHIVLTK